MQLKIGCDPEFFLMDSKRNNAYVSAHDLLPGTKEAPHKVNKGAVQVDGVACEFNIDPANSEDEFVENIQTVLGELRKMIPERYQFVFRPAITFEPLYFKKLPRQAVELGCTPDFSGYTFEANPRPDGDATTMRTASGHVHIGWREPDGSDITREQHLEAGRVARNLDIFLGVPSLKWDSDRKRRLLYGKAGCFRPKPYGVEYRTLSNRWLSEERLMRTVYQGAVAGTLNYFEKGRNCAFMQERPEKVLELLG